MIASVSPLPGVSSLVRGRTPRSAAAARLCALRGVPPTPDMATAAGRGIPAATKHRMFRSNQQEVYPMATTPTLSRRAVPLSRNRTRQWTRYLCALLRTSANSVADEDLWVVLIRLVSA